MTPMDSVASGRQLAVATRVMMTLVGNVVVVVVPQATPIVLMTSTKMMDLAIVSRLRVASIENKRGNELVKSKHTKTSKVESIVSTVRKTLRGWPVSCSRAARRLKILSLGDLRIALSVIS